MSTTTDFNRIEDCDRLDPLCVDAYVEFDYDPDNEAGICLDTSWGGNCLDLTPAINAGETLTTLYLSPEEDPNCLVYVPERGDNICIHGDDLSRIVSMQKLKDVSQTEPVLNGDVYMWNSTTNVFEPFDLQSFVDTANAAIAALQARMTAIEQTIANHETRLQTIEALLVPPTGTPSTARLAWGTINLYSDHNAAIDSNGNVTSLDKTHGLYTHNLSTNALEDEIMG